MGGLEKATGEIGPCRRGRIRGKVPTIQSTVGKDMETIWLHVPCTPLPVCQYHMCVCGQWGGCVPLPSLPALPCIPRPTTSLHQPYGPDET